MVTKLMVHKKKVSSKLIWILTILIIILAISLGIVLFNKTIVSGKVIDVVTQPFTSGDDIDEDGVADNMDNCVNNFNPDQEDGDLSYL